MHFRILICLQSLLFINLCFIERNLNLNEKVTEKCHDHFKAFMPKFQDGLESNANKHDFRCPQGFNEGCS